ncbi:hypothetical protein H8B13_16570 [Hymenobacter sp. BT188]|uniref:hypothetical protein n=1 Tax=Hymenobacter sp. BT188 TaxID=2763504 RepID=UPI0016510F40|nr:hypothetical protein [Hymenobacter sp. BT188]MBC6608442.1 hypothetical protein [Hymenobacter sp. BT188]
MPHKYFLLFGTLLFMALGETVGTVAAEIRPLAATAPMAIGPYAKRKPIKAQYKYKKAPRQKGRPLVRAIY